MKKHNVKRFLSLLLACMMLFQTPLAALADGMGFEEFIILDDASAEDGGLVFEEPAEEVSEGNLSSGTEEVLDFGDELIIDEGFMEEEVSDMASGEVTETEAETEVETELASEAESEVETEIETEEDLLIEEVIEEEAAELAAESENIIASGDCSVADENSVTWKLTDTGVLTISGNGPMLSTNGHGQIGWTSYKKQITSVVIEEGVTSIGAYAFSADAPEDDGYTFTSITIPDTVTSIGKYAFKYAGITEINLPSSITSIGQWAFSYTALQNIAVPSGVTTIDKYVFAGCSALKTVSIPVSVTAIEKYAFRNCDALTSILYAGTEEQWNNVTIGSSGNDAVKTDKVTFAGGAEEPADVPVTVTVNGEAVEVTSLGEREYLSGVWKDPYTRPVYTVKIPENTDFVVSDTFRENAARQFMLATGESMSGSIPYTMTATNLNAYYAVSADEVIARVGGNTGLDFNHTLAFVEVRQETDDRLYLLLVELTPEVKSEYTVTLPSGEGYTVASADGSSTTVTNGGNFSFTVTVADGYDGSAMVVKAGDAILTSDENGVYTITNITADVTVSVSGIEQEEVLPISAETLYGKPLAVRKNGTQNVDWHGERPVLEISYPAGITHVKVVLTGGYEVYDCDAYFSENASNLATHPYYGDFYTLTKDYGKTVDYVIKFVEVPAKVNFTLLGCYVHEEGETEVHTLAANNMSAWIEASDYVIEPGSTVMDLVDRALADNGMESVKPAKYNGTYISAIVKDGVELAEFTNGPRSGWMYTLNGVHPELSAAEQTLKDGDVVVFHYTDDYANDHIHQWETKWTSDLESHWHVCTAHGCTVTEISQMDGYGAHSFGELNEETGSRVCSVCGYVLAEDLKNANEAIVKLPEVEELTINDADKVNEAKAAYEALSEEEQAKLPAEVVSKLEAAGTKIAELQKAAEDQEKATTAAGTITSLPAADKLTKADADKVKAARAAYEALTAEQKALVSKEAVAKLEAAEAKIAELTHVHSWGTGTVTKNATCTAAGVKTFRCGCGETKTETIPAAGHKYGAWKTSKEATVWAAEEQTRVCTVCKEADPNTNIVGKKLTPVLEVPGKLSSFNIKKGKTAKFAVTMAKGDSISAVSSSKTKYLKVSAVDKKTGKITLKGLKKGTSKLTITLASGKTRTYTIKVVTGTVKTNGLSVTNVTANKLTLVVKKSHTLKYELKPFTTTQKVTYKSSNKKIAKVSSSGKITAVAPGKATITVSSGSKKVKIVVTVPGITNVKSSVSVKKNKTLTLKPKTYGISEKVTYTSSNTKIATVTSAGKIKGIRKGTAKITITAGTFKKTVTVKVK